MSLSTDIRDHFSDPKVVKKILGTLNHRISRECPNIVNLKYSLEHKIIDNSCIKFRDFPRESLNEVYVSLGRILENVIECSLAMAGFDVKSERSSSGDMLVKNLIERLLWEIKGTSAHDQWTGSTHASKKENIPMNFLGVGYGLNRDINLFDLLDGKVNLIDKIFIGVFENIQLIRIGTHSENSSRTSLKISVDDYETVKEQAAWGWIKKPRKSQKYLHFETVA